MFQKWQARPDALSFNRFRATSDPFSPRPPGLTALTAEFDRSPKASVWQKGLFFSEVTKCS
jgi:hypothetical protein